MAVERTEGPECVPNAPELAIRISGDKELGAYLADLDELNPRRRYKIIACSIASLFEHEIKIERGSHVRTAEIRGRAQSAQSIRESHCLPCVDLLKGFALFFIPSLT